MNFHGTEFRIISHRKLQNYYKYGEIHATQTE